MKKQIIKIMLIIIISAFCINVYAEDAWPKEYTYKDYGFTVDDVILNIYKIDSTKTVTTTTDDDGTTTTNEDVEAYFNEIPTSTRSLSPTDFTIDPDYKEDKLNKNDVIFIKLNLDLTKEKIEELLAEEIAATTENIMYKVDIAVKYKITDYPEKYKYFNRINLNRLQAKMMNLLMGETVDLSFDITNDTTQVINTVQLFKADADSDVEVKYETRLGEENDLLGEIYNFAMLAEDEESSSIVIRNNDDDIDYSKSIILMFYDVDNIQYLIDSTKEVEPQAIVDPSDDDDLLKDVIKNGQQVQVPNTAERQSIVWCMLGIISIISGVLILTYITKIRKIIRVKQ